MTLVMAVGDLFCDSTSGIYRYRRGVPDRLRPTVGTREIFFSLKTKDRSTALRLQPEYHCKAEELHGHEGRTPTEQITDETTIRDLKSAGLIQDMASRMPRVDTQDTERNLAFSDAILSAADNTTEGQLQVEPFAKNEKVDRLVRAMVKGVELPMLRLSKAVAVSLSAKKTGFNARDLASR
jgi:hypothetical protein